jgi:hypothetical protein
MANALLNEQMDKAETYAERRRFLNWLENRIVDTCEKRLEDLQAQKEVLDGKLEDAVAGCNDAAGDAYTVAVLNDDYDGENNDVE